MARWRRLKCLSRSNQRRDAKTDMDKYRELGLASMMSRGGAGSCSSCMHCADGRERLKQHCLYANTKDTCTVSSFLPLPPSQELINKREGLGTVATV